MDSLEKRTLEAVVRFGPRKSKDICQLVPEGETYDVERALENLKKRGFITLQDEEKRQPHRVWEDDVVQVNTNPFNMPTEDQQSLLMESESVSSEREIIAEKLPDDIDTSDPLSLELTDEQAELFERMRTDVSRTCGKMSREEFMDWVLREARRMTEV